MNEQANFHEEKDDSKENLFVACFNANAYVSKGVWYLDCGCSNHMIGNLSYFVDVDESYESEVTMGNNNKVEVCGIDTVVVISKNGKKLTQVVMCAPGVTHNLLSLGQLMKKGYCAIFDDENCMTYDKKNGSPVYIEKMTANKISYQVFNN